MQIKTYFGLAAVLLLMACSNSENKTNDGADSVTAKTTQDTVAKISFKDSQLESIYASYIVLKDALVAAKSEEAKVAAGNIAASLKTYAGCENTSLIATKIENAKDLAGQRKEFTGLSSDLIALFKHAELSSGTIYVQHCPMANKGDGGDWLASEKKIQNPYYGSEMMECGAVLEEIKTK